jgi:hypothetical protein
MQGYRNFKCCRHTVDIPLAATDALLTLDKAVIFLEMGSTKLSNNDAAAGRTVSTPTVVVPAAVTDIDSDGVVPASCASKAA